MNRRNILVALLTLSMAAPALHAQSTGAVCTAHSTALLDALGRGDYAHAGRDFNATVAGVLGPDRLQSVWTQLQGQFGHYRDHGDPRIETVAGHQAIVTRAHFGVGDLDALVACDDDGHINTFRLVPAAPEPAAKPQAETLPGGIHEQPLPVASPLGPLQGELTLPAGKGPFPAVVLVAGSGPHDRDETIGPNKPFRDIALGLAAQGVASLRYDKRTYAYGSKIAGDDHFTIDEEVTDDALAAVKALDAQPMVDGHRVFVLGHSLGAMLAPRIGRRDPQLAGLILMAAPARPLLDVSADQVRDQGRRAGETAKQIAAGEQAIAAERALLAKADPAHPPAGSFGHAPQSYWMSLRDYDQVTVAKGLSMPMLFLQGGGDFQVSPTRDFDRWKQVLGTRSNVAFHLYPGLSHLFMPAGTTGTIADYEAPAHVEPKVIDDIAHWVKATR